MLFSLALAIVSIGYQGDPHLKQGFPVLLPLASDSEIWNSMVVADTDYDGQKEIVAAFRFNDGTQRLLAITGSGQVQPIFPYAAEGFSRNFAVGEFDKKVRGLEVLTAFTYPATMALSSPTGFLRNFPRYPSVNGLNMAAVIDLDDDGVDDFVYNSEDFKIHLRKASGVSFENFPKRFFNHQAYASVCMANLDPIQGFEIVSISGELSNGATIQALKLDGSPVNGWPISLGPANGIAKNSCFAGDLDGDGTDEVIIARGSPLNVSIYGANAVLRRTISVGDSTTRPSVALGDLDGDSVPEVVVQTATKISVYKGDGSGLPGWPKSVTSTSSCGSPVIGDVDGDGSSDVVAVQSGSVLKIVAFGADGNPLPGFPKALTNSSPAQLALADLDSDGRTELIAVVSIASQGNAGVQPAVWAWNLSGTAYRTVQWGGVGGGWRHLFRYPVIN